MTGWTAVPAVATHKNCYILLGFYHFRSFCQYWVKYCIYGLNDELWKNVDFLFVHVFLFCVMFNRKIISFEYMFCLCISV